MIASRGWEILGNELKKPSHRDNAWTEFTLPQKSQEADNWKSSVEHLGFIPREIKVFVVVLWDVHNEQPVHVLFEVQQILHGVLCDKFLDCFINLHATIITVNTQKPIIENFLKCRVIPREQSFRKFLI